VIDDDLLLTAVHDTGVRRLQHAYADVVNRRAWPELEGLFLDDAVVTIDTRAGEPLVVTGGAGIGRFIDEAVAGFSFFEFVILSSAVEFPDGPGAGTGTARLYLCEQRQDARTGRWSTAFGLYHDRYTLASGRWWFAGRRYHSLARTAADLDVFPYPSATDGTGSGGPR
jgi:hypothetical protein